MPVVVPIETEEGPRFVRLCWCCRETGAAVAAGDPQETPSAAASQPGKCQDCYVRSLAGLPLGRRLDG